MKYTDAPMVLSMLLLLRLVVAEDATGSPITKNLKGQGRRVDLKVWAGEAKHQRGSNI